MFTVSVNAQEIEKSLQQLQDHAADIRVPMQRISVRMMTAVQQNFQQEGRPNHWQPHSPATTLAYQLLDARKHENKLAKRRKDKTPRPIGAGSPLLARFSGDGYRILARSAALKKSIQSGSDSSSAWVSTDIPYAAIHNFGGKAGRGHKVTIPARPFMVIPTQDQAAILRVIGNHLERFRST
jgi:phage gpG-like protein